MEPVPETRFASRSVTALSFKFDELGSWSELKLEIVEKYGAAYTNAFAKQPRLRKYYIDAFSGAGAHVSRRTGKAIEGWHPTHEPVLRRRVMARLHSY